jgi:hypothetical protein
MPKPLCFMIMPYARKPTQVEPGRGPADIDFNALWTRGYIPIITALGYEPVRADQDTQLRRQAVCCSQPIGLVSSSMWAR